MRRQLQDGKTKRKKQCKIHKVDMSDTLLVELQALRKRRKEEYLGRGKNFVFGDQGSLDELVLTNSGGPSPPAAMSGGRTQLSSQTLTGSCAASSIGCSYTACDAPIRCREPRLSCADWEGPWGIAEIRSAS